MNRPLPAILFFLAFVTGGCAPSLSPLYRDYEDVEATGDGVEDRIERALAAAEWTVIDGVTENVVATEPRTFRSWGIYDVEIELEVTPMAGNNVRVLVHPYRLFFQGTRRKVPYLRRSLARSAIRGLSEAFEAEGLAYQGTTQQRDKLAGAR